MGDSQNCIPPKRPHDPLLGEQLTPATIAELRVQLATIKRMALQVVKTVELAQGIPPSQSAMRNRAERRADEGKVEELGDNTP